MTRLLPRDSIATPGILLAALLLLGACGGMPPPRSLQGDEGPPEIYKNTIKWTTASEVDNFGFDVYRGSSQDGPFARLNEDTIEGGGTTDEPRTYRFVDDTIDPYETYYYYVESISMSSEREMFTPVGKASPKIPREGGEGPE